VKPQLPQLPPPPLFRCVSLNKKNILFNISNCINTLGIVYGDIGTSPLYVFDSIFSSAPESEDVLGAMCLVFYTLTLMVLWKYVTFILRADFRGEGGTFPLLSLLLYSPQASNDVDEASNIKPNDFIDLPRLSQSQQKMRSSGEDTVNQSQLGSLQSSAEFTSDVKETDMVINLQEISDNKSSTNSGNRHHGSSNGSTSSSADLFGESDSLDSSDFPESLRNLKESAFLKRPSVIAFFSFLSIFSASLLLGDGVITPAISVLSAIEGLELIGNSVDAIIVPLTSVILFLLFMIQRFGTARVGSFFGPVMLLWFISIGGIGIWNIVQQPSSLKALYPYWGYQFFVRNGIQGWFLLGSVVLAVTGCEAMYADIGHFGKQAVRISFVIIVYPALVCNYFGQGTLLLRNPSAFSNPFYYAVPSPLYWPMILLSTVSTVIASQSLITGAFSIMQQAISLGVFPRMKVVHTNPKVPGQIYIPILNYVLMITCILLVVGFGTSTSLANAYGVAVTGVMTLTSVFYAPLALLRWNWSPFLSVPLVCEFLLVDLSFFTATLRKVPTGGWFPLLVAFCVSMFMITWKVGKEALHEKLVEKQITVAELCQELNAGHIRRFSGTGVFLSAIPHGVPLSLTKLAMHTSSIPETVIFLTIEFSHSTQVQRSHIIIHELKPKGFYRIIAKYSYRDTYINLERMLVEIEQVMPGIHPCKGRISVFLGRENVRTHPDTWIGHRLFARFFNTLLQLSYNPAFAFQIPPESLVYMGSEIYL